MSNLDGWRHTNASLVIVKPKPSLKRYGSRRSLDEVQTVAECHVKEGTGRYCVVAEL